MISTVTFGILLAAYIIVAIINLKNTCNIANILFYVAGAIGLATTFLNKLYNCSFTIYLFWNRIKHWFRNYTAKWKITIRYDGEYRSDLIETLKGYVLTKKENGKILHTTNNSLNFTINDTLSFYVDYLPKHINTFDYDTLDISLTTFEIGCNDSKTKLDKEIIPILTELTNIIKPNNATYMLNISFEENPFFALLVAHLKDEYIKSFTLDLKLNAYTFGDKTDKVSVNKNNITINSSDLHSLKEIAKDFIYLSNNIKRYVKGTKDA